MATKACRVMERSATKKRGGGETDEEAADAENLGVCSGRLSSTAVPNWEQACRRQISVVFLLSVLKWWQVPLAAGTDF